jgi:hypothetical protein
MEKVRLAVTRLTVFALENPEHLYALKVMILPDELLQTKAELERLKGRINDILRDLE